MKTTYQLLIGLVLVAAVGAGGWWAFTSKSGDELAKLSENMGAKLTDSQVDAVVARISKFMVVPSNERPSVVVLQGTADLAKQQIFYRDAKDGDILIVYSTRAIIYDAIANKLVGVSPIVQNTATPVPSADATASSSSATVTPPPAPEEGVKIEVRNGTSIAGLAGKTANELDTKYDWITKANIKAADASGTFKETVLVDMSGGKKPGAVAVLEQYFGLKAVTALPKGESTTTADILVIVGK